MTLSGCATLWSPKLDELRFPTVESRPRDQLFRKAPRQWKSLVGKYVDLEAQAGPTEDLQLQCDQYECVFFDEEGIGFSLYSRSWFEETALEDNQRQHVKFVTRTAITTWDNTECFHVVIAPSRDRGDVHPKPSRWGEWEKNVVAT